jgi:hypothetical protein
MGEEKVKNQVKIKTLEENRILKNQNNNYE